MADISYPIVVVQLPEEDGGGFGAFVPDLRGCMGDGATADEALNDVRDAICEWIDEARRLKRKIPKPGSAAKRAVKDMRDLRNLILTQDKVLQAQDEALSAARAEIASIKERIKASETCADDFMSEGWPEDASFILSGKRKHTDGNIPH